MIIDIVKINKFSSLCTNEQYIKMQHLWWMDQSKISRYFDLWVFIWYYMYTISSNIATVMRIYIHKTSDCVAQGNDRRRAANAIEARRYSDRCRAQRRGGKREGKGREIGMLVSESHPLTPVFRRIVQSIMPPSLSHHHLRGGPKHYLPI